MLIDRLVLHFIFHCLRKRHDYFIIEWCDDIFCAMIMIMHSAWWLWLWLMFSTYSIQLLYSSYCSFWLSHCSCAASSCWTFSRSTTCSGRGRSSYRTWWSTSAGSSSSSSSSSSASPCTSRPSTSRSCRCTTTSTARWATAIHPQVHLLSLIEMNLEK